MTTLSSFICEIVLKIPSELEKKPLRLFVGTRLTMIPVFWEIYLRVLSLVSDSYDH